MRHTFISTTQRASCKEKIRFQTRHQVFSRLQRPASLRRNLAAALPAWVCQPVDVDGGQPEEQLLDDGFLGRGHEDGLPEIHQQAVLAAQFLQTRDKMKFIDQSKEAELFLKEEEEVTSSGNISDCSIFLCSRELWCI